ncbi:hypothetical protein ABL78_6444 [Leptomonas seymouri]|uniref:Uncharacterized protein n=1 Tax=Leptomonas seymouri TaxID=5684 RepID=A0A0N0P3T6_LEPSE|nr:hypothetical protein ABL78_6444 [Leptomonas seymouri]|eukprot:KPI84509.1 hypothetical protein ABL78_6444 [Leptomonas seymouri]
MIPALNMTQIHRSPPTNNVGDGGVTVGQGSGSRLHTGRQMSPRTPSLISPRDTTSSLPSAHLTRRAAEVSPVLEMNPLQCQSISELQRKLVETAEWVIKLRYYYTMQLQERDQWLEARMRGFEQFYADAVSAAVEARMATAVASTTPSMAGANGSTADNGAPATVSTSKAGSLSGGQRGLINEAKTMESEKGFATPPQQRHSASPQPQPQRDSDRSSAASSPKPSMPNSAPTASVNIEAAESGGSAWRARMNQPKKSAVVRIPQGRRTASASGVRRQHWRLEDSSSPRLGWGAQSTVDRGEAQPTRAARITAEDSNNASNSSNNTYTNGASCATRRRCPPALAASRYTTATGFVDASGGPRLDVLAATVQATARRGEGAVLDAVPLDHRSLSTGEANRRRSTSGGLRRRYYTSSPQAATADLSATVPPHSQYLEAGFGLAHDLHGSNMTSSSRGNNGLGASVGSAAELPQSRTPRDGWSTFFRFFGNGGGRSGRVHHTSGSSQASQRSASHGLSGREKRRGIVSANVSSQSSPVRVRPL